MALPPPPPPPPPQPPMPPGGLPRLAKSLLPPTAAAAAAPSSTRSARWNHRVLSDSQELVRGLARQCGELVGRTHGFVQYRLDGCAAVVDAVGVYSLDECTPPCLITPERGSIALQCGFDHLSLDIKCVILQYMPLTDVGKLSRVSWAVRSAVRSDAHFAAHMRTHHPNLHGHLRRLGWSRWRDYYVRHVARGVTAVQLPMDIPASLASSSAAAARPVPAAVAESKDDNFAMILASLPNSSCRFCLVDLENVPGIVMWPEKDRRRSVLALWSPPAATTKERTKYALCHHAVRARLTPSVVVEATSSSELLQEIVRRTSKIRRSVAP